jgi:Fe-S-cluster-containing dehydrogenase component/DMSO reductase anchor subunit
LTTLPLLDSAFVYTAPLGKRTALINIRPAPPSLIPDREPVPGEQYRFAFDMAKCIGCKCCVVACNEQNGNPAAINWRRVGEVEGGHYPFTQRFYLSMGCNHCVEPSCLTGCPVEAFTKSPTSGVVLHSADACIGCQYCTWNCSYGAVQYNAERGVVGKCDLCHHRLEDGMAPACAEACPEGAISIEIVNIEQWRADYMTANAPGRPPADDSISTTRITLPTNIPPDTGRVDTQRLETEQPHWSLVFMLVLTQLSVGAFAALWILDMLQKAGLSVSALVSLAIAGLSVASSTLHLGRPVYAWRALRGLRRSWLSREVLSLSLFAAIASAYALMLFLNTPARPAIGFATVLCGIAGVMCSARIYTVRARPAWDSPYTMAEFFSTALLLGPALLGTMGVSDGRSMAWAAAAGGATQLITQTLKFFWLSRSEQFELRASALLLAGRLRQLFLIRLAILVVAGLVLPLIGPLAWSFPLAIASEFLGRWLFFVSVVPKNTAAAFPTSRRASR